MIKFVYFGRLEWEKGIDMVLDVFTKLHTIGLSDRQLSIYGEGAYKNACESLAKSLPKNVAYHGRTSQEAIHTKLGKSDYCLMPSRIIETFGLSALESLREGTPVIGFKKGGLEPFIIQELNIDALSGKNESEKFFFLIKNICEEHKEKHSFSLAAVDLNISRYTSSAWLKQFSHLAGNTKRILLITDFKRKVGGIETYVHMVKELLEENGYEVKIFGSKRNNSFWGLFRTACNVPARRKLRKKIKKFAPDLIWCHSVIRELGWLPLTAIPPTTRTRMMFHDMGYFFPYPSRLYSIGQIPKTDKITDRIRSGRSGNPIKRLLLGLKRFSLCLIKKTFDELGNITYLVPAGFIKPLAEKHRESKGKETIVLPHFVK